MALPATGVYEIRATATANNVNGGGFNSARGGTDYTLQDAAQYTATDLTQVSSNSVTCTSATAGFTADMVGNYIHITAGTSFTVGWYEIVVVNSSTSIDLDRDPTASGTGSSGTFYVGGALSMNSTLDDDVFETAVAGNIFYVRGAAGTVTIGETVTIAAGGGSQNPIKIIGYNSTRGDNPTGSTRPTLAFGANGATLGSNWEMYYLIYTGTAASLITLQSNSKFIWCKGVNASTTANRSALTTGTDSSCISCEFISYRGRAVTLGVNVNSLFRDCWVHSSDVGFFSSTSSGYHVLNEVVVSGCVTAAIQFSGAVTARFGLADSALFGALNTKGIGVSLATGCTDIFITNTIISGFVTGVSHADVQSVGFDDFNCYHNNDTDVTNWTKGDNDVTTDPAFTNVGQVTGTAGAFTAGNDRLIDTTKNFTSLGVVAGDHIHIVSGTGVTAGIYAISSITTDTNPNDTLILTPAPGTNTTADKTYEIETGHDFMPTGAINVGNPGPFPGGFTTGVKKIGAFQNNGSGGGSGSGGGVGNPMPHLHMLLR